MKEIHFDHPHRQKHFEYFREMSHPHFNITANIEIGDYLTFMKSRNISTTPGIVYLISRTANEIKEFRWRIRGEKVIEHDLVHPSYSVATDVADVFSFCTVNYDEEISIFLESAQEISNKMKMNPSIEDDKDRDDFLFLSTIPWVSFTSFQHAMNYHPSDSVPRFVWGKFFHQEGKIWMPLSVQVHHAVVDGRHVGRCFQEIEALATALSLTNQ